MECFAFAQLTKYLLEKTPTGPNAMNDKGWTPLDSLVAKVRSGSLEYTEETHDSIQLLAQHGGCLGKTSKPEWKHSSNGVMGMPKSCWGLACLDGSKP